MNSDKLHKLVHNVGCQLVNVLYPFGKLNKSRDVGCLLLLVLNEGDQLTDLCFKLLLLVLVIL